MTPCAMQWTPNKFVLHMPLQCWQREQRALARTDMGSIQSTHAEIRGSPRLLPEIHWPPLPPFSLALSKIQKSVPYVFKMSLFHRVLPPFFFLRPIKNKSLPERQQGKKKGVWYHWIQPVRISHIKELCPWALSNRLSENFIFLLSWLDSLFE